MKLWPKVIIFPLIAFLVGFSLLTFFLIKKSHQDILENEIHAVDNEAYLIAQLLEEKLGTAAAINPVLDEQNFPQSLISHVESSLRPNTYFILLKNHAVIYSNFASSLDIATAKNGFVEIEGQPYVLIEKELDLAFVKSENYSNETFTFIYLKSEIFLSHQLVATIYQATGLSILFSILMVIIFIVMACKYIHCLQDLNHAARGISAGNYQLRVKHHRQAGLEELTRSFNAMAVNVDRHVQELKKVSCHQAKFYQRLNS